MRVATQGSNILRSREKPDRHVPLAKPDENPSRRLDEELVKRGLAPSRSRARDAVLRGTVKVDGKVVIKAGQVVSPTCVLEVDDPAQHYVSRAALKLIAALDASGFDPSGLVALDIGASTGGFSQVLLERNVSKLFSIDVGHGQLHPMIEQDPRVTSLEGLNARELSLDDLGGVVPQMIVSDVSFISLRLALPPALEMAAPGALGIFLVKPQFEAGREAIGKGGLLRKPEEAEMVALTLRDWLGTMKDWRPVHFLSSPIPGSDGNQEFLLTGIKS